VYRFCIGVQFEVTRDMSLKSRLSKLDKLIKLLPQTIEVASRAVGHQHTRSEALVEGTTALETKLESALEGKTIGPKPEVPLMDAAYYADNHQIMKRDLGAYTRCDQIDTLAECFGINPPAASPWLQMFCEVAERLPHALIITDMKVPGLPLMFCNVSFEALTGYSKAEAQGRNCRFLQGKGTEAAAVREIVSSIRSAKQITVRVTNYRKGGSDFVNELSLHPVHDSNGDYRFSIGTLHPVSSQAATIDNATRQETRSTSVSPSRGIHELRKLLPTNFDANQEPSVVATQLASVDEEAQREQWKSSVVKFTRLLWSMDWERSFSTVLERPEAIRSFGRYLQDHPDLNGAAIDLELMVLFTEMQKAPAETKGIVAIQLCQRYLGVAESSGDAAISILDERVASQRKDMALGSFPKFVQSKACLPMVEELIGGAGDELRRADALLWGEYSVPADVAGWLHSFVTVAETYPACIVISDMSMPGNPMVFTNAEFCRVTGYAKHEAQGRNCRFLQGPRTEPQSVAVIQDTLRRGVDCHVKITNYRKSGELFENLLTMRPVHDSNGVYRFCIGVQFEVTRDMSLKSRLSKLDKLIKLLPQTIEVGSKAIGLRHTKAQVMVEQSTALETKLESALEGKTIGPQPEQQMQDPACFADNHQEMLMSLQASTKAHIPAAASNVQATVTSGAVVSLSNGPDAKASKSSWRGKRTALSFLRRK